MKTILAITACLLALTKFIYEDAEFLSTNLGARLFIYGQILITGHLWACGSTWKSSSLHMLGILASINLDTTKPHPAAHGLLLHACLSLFCIILTFDKDKHVRTLSQLCSSSPPQEVHVPDISWADLPLLAPYLFDMVEIIDTDNSSDEDHWPPNFLNKPFMVENSAPDYQLPVISRLSQSMDSSEKLWSATA